MPRLLRATVILIAALAGAVLVVRLVGKMQPDPLALWFTNPDGSACKTACLFGITPGVTMYADAVRIIAEHPVTRGMKIAPLYSMAASADMGWGNSDICVTLWQRDDGGLSEISASPDECLGAAPPHPLEVSLGQIVASLGLPIRVNATQLLTDDYYFADGKVDFTVLLHNNPCDVTPSANYRALSLLDRNTIYNERSTWYGFSERSLSASGADLQRQLATCLH